MGLKKGLAESAQGIYGPENITDPSDAKATLVHFCQYFAYPDSPYNYIHCYLLCCQIIQKHSLASQDQSYLISASASRVTAGLGRADQPALKSS